MKHLPKFFRIFQLLVLGVSLSFVEFTFGMEVEEEIVGEALEEAFPEEAGGISREGLENFTKEVGNEFNVSPEKMGELTGELKEDFEAQLKDAFGDMQFDEIFKEGSFEKSEKFSTQMQSAKEGFESDLSGMNKAQGLSDAQYDVAKEFKPDLEQIPPKSEIETKTFKIEEKIGGEFKDPAPKTSTEANLESSEQKVEGLKRDEEHYDELGNKEKLADTETKLNDAQTEVKTQREAVHTEQDSAVETGQTNVEQKSQAATEATTSEKPAAEKSEEMGKSRSEQQKAEDDLEDSEKKKAKTARKEYNDAKEAKEGTKEQKEKIDNAQKKIKEAVNEAKKAGKDPNTDPAVKEARKELAQTRKEGSVTDRHGQAQIDQQDALKERNSLQGERDKLKVERDTLETKANEMKTEHGPESDEYKEAQSEFEKKDTEFKEKDAEYNKAVEKFETADQYLKDMAEADGLADENLDAAKKRCAEACEGHLGLKAEVRLKAMAETLKEHIINGILGGIFFTLPNLAIGAIESAMAAKGERDTLLMPQWFGGVWMQIPRNLISGEGDPIVAKYLYVAIPGAKSTDKGVKRSDAGDADSYLEHAAMYTARSEYDKYAEAAITSPMFPGRMVHLNTGFNFITEGKGDFDWPVIQFLAADKGELPKDFRGEPLQFHLNEQAGDVLRGISSIQYFESREEPTKYEGSPTISYELDSNYKPQKDQVKKQYPNEENGYGSILNNSINTFANGTKFGEFTLRAMRPLSTQAQQALGITGGVEAKPWIAYGQFIYESSDSPAAKAAREDPANADIADELVEYFVVTDDTKGSGDVIPLQFPSAVGNPYGIASYQLNPHAESIISLVNLKAYNNRGTSYVTGIKTVADALKGVQIRDKDVVGQITQMGVALKSAMEKKGEFKIGGKTLTRSKEWADANLAVYKIEGGLEGGSDDYMVAVDGSKNVETLPASPTFFFSLVTSRIYGPNLLPFMKKYMGYGDVSYRIFKLNDEPRVQTLTTKDLNKTVLDDNSLAITNVLKAPFYSLFMNRDINPNRVSPSDFIPDKGYEDWYSKKVGGLQKDGKYVLAVPEQWALGSSGPRVADKSIGDVLQEHESLKDEINKAYGTWKTYYEKQDPKVLEVQMGPFAFVDVNGTARSIYIHPTSAADILNKNYVYVSPNWPDEYFVVSNNKDGSGSGEYDGQQYAISLSNGAVHDSQADGEIVGQVKSVEDLLNIVQKDQGAFKDPLKKIIQASQTIAEKDREKYIYGDDTFFGPFKFYIDPQDLDRGQYVYADMTPFGDPLKMSKDELNDALNKANYFVGIDLKTGIVDDPEKGNENLALDPNNWEYGKQISDKTVRVVCLVTGILYDRTGGYQGYIKEFGTMKPVTDDSDRTYLDLQKGYFNSISQLLATTWKLAGSEEVMRPELSARIKKLTDAEYKKLLAEKQNIADAFNQDKAQFPSLASNTISNIDAEKYVEVLQKIKPVRYVKEYNGKYYGAIPDNPGPKTYLDYAAGTTKDGKEFGMVYDGQGNGLVRLTGWTLEAARAYAGIVVKDGKQEIDLVVDHPAIPMDGMVELDETKLDKKLADARSAYQKAIQATKAATEDGKKPADDLTDALAKASRQLGIANQEHQASQMAKAIIANLTTHKLYANYKFYYNETIGSYFIGIPGADGTISRYIDLQAGYQFNADGSPRLYEFPVFTKSGDKDDLLLVGRDTYDMFTAVFKNNEGTYYNWQLTDEKVDKAIAADPKGRYGNGDVIKYLYFVTLPEWVEDTESKEVVYEIYEDKYHIVVETDKKSIELAEYNDDTTRKFSPLRYFRTEDASGKGTYQDDDAKTLKEHNPTIIIWDGKPDLNLEQIYYKGNMIKLSGKGNSFTGQYKVDDKQYSITVKKIVKEFSPLVKAHYISISDSGKTYDFMYDTVILDPKLPVTCNATDLAKELNEMTHLNWWKQCPQGWNLNVVIDARGINRLMMGIDKQTLTKAPALSPAALKAAGDRAAILQANAGLIKYDSGTNQYFYELTARHDTGWAYYQPTWAGWYVDLSNGVLYSINPVDRYALYPVGAMHLSQLYFLLDRLEIAIGPVQDPTGETLYDSEGNPVMDPATNQPIKTKPGIMYRSSTVVKSEKSIADGGGQLTILNEGAKAMAEKALTQQQVGKKVPAKK